MTMRRKRHSIAEKKENQVKELPRNTRPRRSKKAEQQETSPVKEEHSDVVNEQPKQPKSSEHVSLQDLKQAKQRLLEQLKLKNAGALLQKLEDPITAKVTTHHDYLLQEMRWMAADFAQERKWKRSRAKKQARGVLLHYKNLESKAIREKKMVELNRRRTAAKLGREVRKFWGKIDKIVAYKLKLVEDESRKKSMDKHLRYLVEQTEKYSNALACTLTDNSHHPLQQQQQQPNNQTQQEQQLQEPDDTKTSSTSLTEPHSVVQQEKNQQVLGHEDARELIPLQEIHSTIKDEPHTIKKKKDNNINTNTNNNNNNNTNNHNTFKKIENAKELNVHDEDYYIPSDEDELDDETTIALEENLDPSEQQQELDELAEDNLLSIEELKLKYAAMQSPQNNHEENDSDDYSPPTDEEDGDDETTIALEEALEHEEGTNNEIAELLEDNQLSIEELRKKYSAMEHLSDSSDQDSFYQKDENRNDTSIEIGSSTKELLCTTRVIQKKDENTTRVIQKKDEKEDNHNQDNDTESSTTTLAVEGKNHSIIEQEEQQHQEHQEEQQHQGQVDVSVAAAPPKKIPRPFLLNKTLRLREYQQVGLDWLVSMYQRRMNGILADEMGLGKTIQTIALLSHLACQDGIWGPHLIVVPTSCMLNWEMEFKRWCPAFKILTYYGNAKRRKELRQGWTRLNAFHVCITSYQLVVQDAHCFRRKKWYFLILDEAHNIKNWKSQRWQTLLNFNSQRRLLLTGTPLQNNLMELWALMHFLMPHVFRSRKEFSYWFSNPLNSMVEGEQQVNDSLVGRLHGVIRPFLLRRLKKDVAKQLPEKYEHTITCSLSRRQRFLYEDFISRSSTRTAMSGGNFLSMMNVLMQLRKVCNHPDLFEPRPIVSSFDFPLVVHGIPSLVVNNVVSDKVVGNLGHWNLDHLCTMESQGMETWNYPLIQDLKVSKEDFLNRRFTTNNNQNHQNNLPLPLSNTSKTLDFALVTETPQDVLDYCTKMERENQMETMKVRERNAFLNEMHCRRRPLYGANLIRRIQTLGHGHAMAVAYLRDHPRFYMQVSEALKEMVMPPEVRVEKMMPIAVHVACYVPKVRAMTVKFSTSQYNLSKELLRTRQTHAVKQFTAPLVAAYYEAHKRTQIFFPDKRLIQFDCGKLQQLDTLLRKLKRGQHRCLIFTQMSSMLDILEKFLSIHGHTYFRLDGATKVDRRQRLMDRFNSDERIFAFILSTRSGGLGINLTGADTVIFYDSDWNPAMDAQAQDRAHRIGQTRDVHIYRFVSEFTVEENIIKKARQKRHLDFLVLSEGKFTTEFFSKTNLRDLVGSIPASTTTANSILTPVVSPTTTPANEMSFTEIENAMAELEDDEDREAMQGAKKEALEEQLEFEEEEEGHPTVKQDDVEEEEEEDVIMDEDREGEDEDEDGDRDGDGDGEEHSEDDDVEEVEEDDDNVEEEEDDNVEEEDDDDVEEEEDENDPTTTRRTRSKMMIKKEKKKMMMMKKKKNVNNMGKRFSSSSSSSSLLINNKLINNKLINNKKNKKSMKWTEEKKREKELEAEQERELQAWKLSVSLASFEDGLCPVERYALHFREEIDPPWGWETQSTKDIQNAAAAAAEEEMMELDIMEIEAQKALEEEQQLLEGELIAGELDETQDHKSLYLREKTILHRERKRRKLTGEAWVMKREDQSGRIYYLNHDTWEATWEKPSILHLNQQQQEMRQLGYSGISMDILIKIIRYLDVFPDRFQLMEVCTSWKNAGSSPFLYKRISASGGSGSGGGGGGGGASSSETSTCTSTCTSMSLDQLLPNLMPGETVVLGDGIHTIDRALCIKIPIRIMGMVGSQPTLEMKETLKWKARGGMISGITLRRSSNSKNSSKNSAGSSSSSSPFVLEVNGGSVRICSCDVDGKNTSGACVYIVNHAKVILYDNHIYNSKTSGVFQSNSDLILFQNSIMKNAFCGVVVLSGHSVIRKNHMYNNSHFGIRLFEEASVLIEYNDLQWNGKGSIDVDRQTRKIRIRSNEMCKKQLEHEKEKKLLAKQLKEEKQAAAAAAAAQQQQHAQQQQQQLVSKTKNNMDDSSLSSYSSRNVLVPERLSTPSHPLNLQMMMSVGQSTSAVSDLMRQYSIKQEPLTSLSLAPSVSTRQYSIKQEPLRNSSSKSSNSMNQEDSKTEKNLDFSSSYEQQKG